MKSEKNILIAFILNLSFSIFELIGGSITNSVAIVSDAVHDLGDSFSIGLSYILERISKRKPDNKYTYGYIRYSLIGSILTTLILLVSSLLVVINAILRIINPVNVNYNGMIIFAIIGVIVNFMATYFTKDGESLNQKSVNLHMVEDVLGWLVVLIGAIVMKFTNVLIIDSLLSIGVSIFIFINALKNLKEIIELFLEKTPKGININEITEYLLKIKGIEDVHHIHVWSIDGIENLATVHIVSKDKKIKNMVREQLKEFNIHHVTIELEDSKDECYERNCEVKTTQKDKHHHHH